jgi:hypothetical protein
VTKIDVPPLDSRALYEFFFDKPPPPPPPVADRRSELCRMVDRMDQEGIPFTLVVCERGKP